MRLHQKPALDETLLAPRFAVLLPQSGPSPQSLEACVHASATTILAREDEFVEKHEVHGAFTGAIRREVQVIAIRVSHA